MRHHFLKYYIFLNIVNIVSILSFVSYNATGVHGNDREVCVLRHGQESIRSCRNRVRINA